MFYENSIKGWTNFVMVPTSEVGTILISTPSISIISLNSSQIRNMGLYVWNPLSHDIKSSPSLNIFKRKGNLKHSLLNSYYTAFLFNFLLSFLTLSFFLNTSSYSWFGYAHILFKGPNQTTLNLFLVAVLPLFVYCYLFSVLCLYV